MGWHFIKLSCGLCLWQALQPQDSYDISRKVLNSSSEHACSLGATSNTSTCLWMPQQRPLDWKAGLDWGQTAGHFHHWHTHSAIFINLISSTHKPLITTWQRMLKNIPEQNKNSNNPAKKKTLHKYVNKLIDTNK